MEKLANVSGAPVIKGVKFMSTVETGQWVGDPC